MILDVPLTRVGISPEFSIYGSVFKISSGRWVAFRTFITTEEILVDLASSNRPNS